MRATTATAAWCLPQLLAMLALAGAASAHSMAMDGVASPLLSPGASFTLVIDGAGDYDVACHLHPDMVASLQVLAGADTKGPQEHDVDLVDGGQAGDGAFRDAATGSTRTVLHAGDRVTWTNTGNHTHDVHLVRTSAAAGDNGAFELVVLGGLVVTLAAVFLASRR